MLWGEEPPATAAKSLQSHIMRVRRLLEGAGAADVIETVENGYRLVLEPGSIDASRFEAAVAKGRTALDQGDAVASASILGDALALWRGEALRPATAPGLNAFRTRLDELHHQAFELYAEAKLATGDHEALVSELRDAVDQDPYKERLWCMLMVALYRSGRQSEALAAYQQVRTVLLDELGVDPGPELQDLERRILGQDVELAESDASVSALPPVMESESGRLFVGRQVEVDLATSALEASKQGQRCLMLVSGEAGIGKSVFTSRVAKSAATDGFQVLYGRCDELLAAPYQPFVHALRSYVTSQSVPRLGANPGELARLVPEIGGATSPNADLDPETERLRLFDAVVGWLREASRSTPMLLILEDVHWAGGSTLLLLRHIVRELVSESLTILANFRPHGVTDDAGLDALLAEATRQPGLYEFELGSLTQDDVATFLEQSPDGVEDVDSAELLAASGGNPLYMSELASQVRSGGVLPADERDVPTGVQRTVDARFRSLSADATRVVELAALAGEVFRFDLVRVAFPEVDVDGPLLQAVDSGLIVELPGRDLAYQFAHALTRLAIAGRPSQATRARYHLQIAHALELSSAASLAEIARHFRAALPIGPVEPALQYTLAAAQEALAQFADEAAAELFDTALRLDPMPGDEVAVRIGLGEAQRRVGDPNYRTTLLDAFECAAAEADGEQMARALLTGYRGTFSRALQVDRTMVERLESTAKRLASDSSLHAQVLAYQAVELAWDPDWRRAKELSDQALAMARRVGDNATTARVLALRHWTVYDSLADRLATTAELDEVAGRVQDPALEFEAAGMATFTFTRVGDHDQATHRLRQAESLAETLNRPPERWMLLIRQFANALRVGEYDQAERFLNEGLALGTETGQPDAASQFGVQQFWLANDRQPADEGIAMMQGLVANFRRSWPGGWPSFLYRCIELELEDEARQILDAFDERNLVDDSPQDQIRTSNLCVLAMAAAFFDDADLASRVLPQLEPASGQHANSVFVSLGAVDRYLGLAHVALGDLDTADACLASAIESNRPLPAWKARALLDRATVQDRLGAGLAAELAEDAYVIATDFLLPVLRTRAQSLRS
jgi:DNA-binding SARP family transcriptional activator